MCVVLIPTKHGSIYLQFVTHNTQRYLIICKYQRMKTSYGFCMYLCDLPLYKVSYMYSY